MIDTQKLFSDLTDSQQEAVAHVDGPLLIIAGAGSGKTRVVTRRVAHLMSLGIPPGSILAITFTNKAAGEMKSRVGALLGRELRDFGQLDQPWPLVCTFHSLGMRILRKYGRHIGLPENFTIYDSSDQEKLIKEAIKAAELSSTQFSPGYVQSVISNAKNRLMTADDFARENTRFPHKNIARAFSHYQKLLDQNHGVDFDDLLLKPALLFREKSEVLQELQDRFAYVLIDEYQDTNHAQYIVAHALALRHKNICVVGDPDQSIYAWRGADIQNILDFEKDYPGAKVVRLEQNYRSTASILAIASKLIANNRQRKDKALWTQNPDGLAAKLLVCEDEYQEALAIAGLFRQLHEAGRSYGQMAIFYRINALSRVMEDALRRSQIPYRIARGVEFYGRKEIKDVLAYLRMIVNPDDQVSLRRIINTPARGIGETAIKQLEIRAMANQWTLWQTLGNLQLLGDVPPRIIKAIDPFVKMIHSWQEQVAKNPQDVRQAVEMVLKQSGLEEFYSARREDAEGEQLSNVQELISDAAHYQQETSQGNLADYLARVTLVSDADTIDQNVGVVTLMTLHAAKGLEFPVVAMIAMEEQILPHARVREHPEQLEEERRLCFVGITRAQEQLIFSRAQRRMMRGVCERTAGSRFLAEMPPEHLEEIPTGPGRSSRPQPDEADQTFEQRENHQRAGRFSPGQRVSHPMFGQGKIVDISQLGDLTRAVVEFPRVGKKNLILEYARLEPC